MIDGVIQITGDGPLGLPEGVEDMGRCLPDGNPWAGSTSFRNLSTNSLYGQFDMVKSSEHGSSNPYNHVFTDSNGEFEVFPLGDPRCSNRSSQGGEVFKPRLRHLHRTRR
ncbi:MAG: hypothetical protein Ct9H300mP4_04360 [Gammaproteobacteria bacterium]|nr:MAG: hypothetical protein Ct9H300mP4_04360 [Gammaproteobacteria bacterium]